MGLVEQAATDYYCTYPYRGIIVMNLQEAEESSKAAARGS